MGSVSWAVQVDPASLQKPHKWNRETRVRGRDVVTELVREKNAAGFADGGQAKG